MSDGGGGADGGSCGLQIWPLRSAASASVASTSCEIGIVIDDEPFTSPRITRSIVTLSPAT